MLDIQFIRQNAKLVKEKSQQKGYKVDINRLIEVDDKRRGLIVAVEELKKARRKNAEAAKGHKPTEEEIKKGVEIKEKLGPLEEQLANTEKEWKQLLKQIPNMPLNDVPVGASEDENVVAKTVGKKPTFDFEPKNHWEIAEANGWIDKERAAKVTGSRFAYLKGDLVRLQWALFQFGLDRLTDKKFIQEIISENSLEVSDRPFTPVLTPLMIRTEIYDAMDRLEPKDDRYKIEGEELWLQGSAEHVLGSMHANETLEEDELPLRYVGYATSFRKEAGTYGKDLEGIIRMHQFDKLEMESFSTPESALEEHLFMIAIQEKLMQGLELPYQLINKCTADIGKPNARGWDINVWMPGQNKYRETHTADYMTDYQARRLGTRYRDHRGQTHLIHTSDATVFSQRPLIAIIENYQTKDGNVRVPKALQPYMGGRDVIS
jgi:seryl-tRNA synthetase